MTTLLYDRPRLLAIVLLMLAAAGLAALATMPRLEDPPITNRNATILTPFPGASAGRVEAQVTEPLERELRDIAEIDTIESISQFGLSVINIELVGSVSGTAATEDLWTRVRDHVESARPELPAGVGDSTVDADRFPAFTVIAALTWTEEGPPNLAILSRYGEELRTRLRYLPATDDVRVIGAVDEEILVDIDAERLAALGLHAEVVADALAGADPKRAAGVLRTGEADLLIELAGAFETLERIAAVPLTVPDGATVRLGDVADIRRAQRDPPGDIALVDGAQVVLVATRMAAGAQVGPWTERVRAELAAFSEDLPHGVALDTLFDQSGYAEDRFAGLAENLVLGLAIVLTVLTLTLGWRAAIIVGAALPLTSLGALAVLAWKGISINQMSITGLIVAMGLVVDASIVMTDAIRARLAEGIGPREAVARSVRVFAAPLAASTLTTMLAFMPIALLPGATGEFVGGIALALIASLGVSYLIAISVTAALAGLFREKRLVARPGFWRTGLTIPPLRRVFELSLDAALRFPRFALLLAAVLPVTGLYAATTMTEQFFPPAGRDMINVEVRLPAEASIARTRAVVERLDATLAEEPDLRAVHWVLGTSAPSNYYNLVMDEDGVPNFAQAQVYADSREAAERLIPRLQAALDRAAPEAQVLVRAINQGPPFEAPLEVRLYGPDTAQLRLLGEEVRRVMAGTPQVTHTRAQVEAGEPKLLVTVDEELAARAGLRLAEIAARLDARQEGVVGGSVLEGEEELPVRVRVDGAARASLAALSAGELAMPGRAGLQEDLAGAPLAALGELALVPESSAIARRNGQRVNTVFGYIAGGALPEAVLDAFSERLDASDFALPAGTRMEIGGENAERNEATGNLAAAVPALAILMLAATALTFNSFRLSGVVFVVAGQAFGLGLLAVAVAGYPLGFQAMIGLMGLVGLAINAAIIIMSAFGEDAAARTGDPQALRRVVVERASRHIVSTTVTTAGGFTPLILAGGGFWPPFAMALAGGTVLATIISFYFVPPAYMLLRRGRAKAVVAVTASGRQPESDMPGALPA